MLVDKWAAPGTAYTQIIGLLFVCVCLFVFISISNGSSIRIVLNDQRIQCKNASHTHTPMILCVYTDG